jgi:hypothetical protein
MLQSIKQSGIGTIISIIGGLLVIGGVIFNFGSRVAIIETNQDNINGTAIEAKQKAEDAQDKAKEALTTLKSIDNRFENIERRLGVPIGQSIIPQVAKQK